MWCWWPTLSLFAFDGRMALAALWVVPVSAAIVMGSYRVQDRVQTKTMAAKMACADGIQEYIETLRDLKASNNWANHTDGTLFGASGLPVAPFRTDNW